MEIFFVRAIQMLWLSQVAESSESDPWSGQALDPLVIQGIIISLKRSIK